MHGIIFTSLRDYAVARLGAQSARQIFDGGPVHAMSEAYPDEEFFGLIERIRERATSEPSAFVRDFGVFMGETTFPRLYPAFFAIAGDTRRFLLTIETRIHELVRATIPHAAPPELHVEPLDGTGVRISYTSPRRLCRLLEGLVIGTARSYGERADIVEVECMYQGATCCLFEVRVSADGESGAPGGGATR